MGRFPKLENLPYMNAGRNGTKPPVALTRTRHVWCGLQLYAAKGSAFEIRNSPKAFCALDSVAPSLRLLKCPGLSDDQQGGGLLPAVRRAGWRHGKAAVSACAPAPRAAGGLISSTPGSTGIDGSAARLL